MMVQYALQARLKSDCWISVSYFGDNAAQKKLSRYREEVCGV